jgi:thiamine-monophosphate kinase
LGEDADTFGCPLLGGDTDSTPGPISISVAAFGTLPSGTMVKRSGAKPGDHVFVSGTIGDAALGLRVRKGELADASGHLVARYRVPQPRVALADALRAHANAAMDVSDGLVGDLAKLCAVSNVSADVDVARVPLSDAASSALGRDCDLIKPILTGGEDYEILCTIPEPRIASFRRAADKASVPVTQMGRIVEGVAPPRFLNPQGQPMTFLHTAYSHF